MSIFFNTFRNRLLLFIVTIIIILGITNFLSFSFSKVSSNEYKDIIRIIFLFNDFSNHINNSNNYLEDFIQISSSDLKQSYLNSIDEGEKTLKRIENLADSEDMYYQVKGLKNLVSTYNEYNLKIIEKIEKKGKKDFLDELMYSKKVYGYINDKINKLNTLQIIDGNNKYDILSQKVEKYGFIVMVIVAFTFILSIVFSIRFTNKVSYPINRLTEYAEEITHGNFEVEDVTPEGNDEISILTVSLNKMKNSIKNMILELKEKAIIESELKEKEVENLKIKNMLKNAELKMLQSQINPHFLFNTLNSIGRLAYNEGCKNVVALIEAVSNMLRYNLRKIDKSVTLGDEIDNLKRYIYIQEMRFGDRLKINLDISSNRMNTPIPCLTLQPIIENSIIHGLQPYDYNGRVDIFIYDYEQSVFIEIIDNGIGMDEEKIESIFKKNIKHEDYCSTGIGIRNVISRLEVFYKRNDCFKIESNIGEGTKVQLIINNNSDKREE